jgi:selenocysteine lyase/cysteine desulfurase
MGSDQFSRLVAYEDRYQSGAKRFDIGEYSSFTLLPMLAAAVEQVSEWTPSAVQQYCRRLTEPLAAAAAAMGYQLEERAFRAGHLMGIRMPEGLDTQSVKARLQERNIFVSIRGQAVRVAPHVYSRKEDIDALIEVLAECAGVSR